MTYINRDDVRTYAPQVGDKVRLGKGTTVWTVNGVYPIDPHTQQPVGEAQWVELHGQYNAGGYWARMTRRVHDFTRLSEVTA